LTNAWTGSWLMKVASQRTRMIPEESP